MVNTIISEMAWESITDTCRYTKRKSFVAVAYFGKGGAAMLPLREGSVLVVDASEAAVKSGQTCPEELLKLYRKGVLVFSMPQLHAKVFVIGTRLFIGSANVSSNSAHALKEAVLFSADRKLVAEGKRFVQDLRAIELGPERLKELQKIYRPPVFDQRMRGKRSLVSAEPRLHVFRLSIGPYTPGHEETLQLGTVAAKKKQTKRQRHYLDEFEWKVAEEVREGDQAVLILEENDKLFVYPPAVVLHIQKWKGKHRSFIFLEAPRKPKRNINSLPKYFNASPLKRSGIKNAHFAQLVNGLWK